MNNLGHLQEPQRLNFGVNHFNDLQVQKFEKRLFLEVPSRNRGKISPSNRITISGVLNKTNKYTPRQGANFNTPLYSKAIFTLKPILRSTSAERK